MKYLNKFYTYLTESNSFDIKELIVTGGTSYDEMSASEITLGSDFIRIRTVSEDYKQKQFNNFIKGIVDLDKVTINKYVERNLVDQEVINDIKLK